MIRGSDIPLFLAVAALALGAASLLWAAFTEWRLRRLFRGRGAQSLEPMMQAIAQELDGSLKKHRDVDALLNDMETRLQKSAKHFGLIRFNPYSDEGGDQSFALAVLNEHKSGFVISSLFHRDGTRIYAKPITAGASSYPLSSEEQGAIAEALA